MKDLLMSIKPQYSQAILRGEKDVEFRRVFSHAALNARRVYIYESAPTMKIVGSFAIPHEEASYSSWWNGGKDRIWDAVIQLQKKPGLAYEAYNTYTEGAKSPWVLCITDVVKFEITLDPRRIDPAFRPPQSYMWMPDALKDVCGQAERDNRIASKISSTTK